MTASKYKCEDHFINNNCHNCFTAITNRYEELLEFVKHIGRVNEDENIVLAEAEFDPDNYTDFFEARALLTEIGELK